MARIIQAAFLATSLLLPASSPARMDDTARCLPAIHPSAESPLAALTRDQSWLQHAGFFDRAFGALDRTQLGKIRAWSGAQLRTRRPALFYMFSGPAFLYADAF